MGIEIGLGISIGLGITLNPPLPVAPSSVEYLVVAGGGGGGTVNDNQAYGGGGGAGGLLANTATDLLGGTTYTITIGAGGTSTGGSGGGVGGINGSNSSISGSGFTSVVSVGGGAGGARIVGANSSGTGGNGGSGGGSQRYASGRGIGIYPGSTYIDAPRQGYDGGIAIGGGGGANAAATSYAGGAGLASSITGSSITYATGGTAIYAVRGGPTNPAPANTGNGGEGATENADAGGAGGSGIVILRYSDTFPAASSTTGSPTITVAGGYRIYKFTSSGSITF